VGWGYVENIWVGSLWVRDGPLSATGVAGANVTAMLKGLFFHSFVKYECDCTLAEWQGIIEGEVVLDSGLYLVQLFEWFGGTDSNQQLVRTEQMERDGWYFYKTADQMNERWELILEHRSEIHRLHHLDSPKLSTLTP